MSRVGWLAIFALIVIAIMTLRDLLIDQTMTELNTPASASKFANTDSGASDVAENDVHFASNSDVSPSRIDAVNEDDVVMRWMRSVGSDATEQAAATDALIKAPREKTLPMLRFLIVDGSAEERQLSIDALRVLAFKQGDENGEVQNILRLLRYDGDDALAGNAQLTLEAIESNLALTGSTGR
ncbi:MAG: hypothetical protein QM709_15095 [Spongiibacteraceae bacterium]